VTVRGPEPVPTVLVVDMANVVGSVPDGWWRDRVGAAARLLSDLAPLAGTAVIGPDGALIRLTGVVAVLEGKATMATDPPRVETAGLEIVRAADSGDDAITDLALELVAASVQVLVVTADRGLRARLPGPAMCAGPGWLNKLLGRA